MKFLKSPSSYENFSGTFFPTNTLFSVEKYYSSSEEGYLKLNNKYHFDNNTLVMELKWDTTINGKKGELVVGKLFFDKQ